MGVFLSGTGPFPVYPLQLFGRCFGMLAQVSGNFWPVNEGAVDAAPEPLASFRLDKLAELRVFAGIEGTEAMSAVLALEMVTWIVLTLASFDVGHGLVGGGPDATGIVGY